MKKKYYKKYELPENNEIAIVEKMVQKSGLKKFLNFDFEDIVILVLIFIMLTEENPDYLTVAALGFIFFA